MKPHRQAYNVLGSLPSLSHSLWVCRSDCQISGSWVPLSPKGFALCLHGAGSGFLSFEQIGPSILETFMPRHGQQSVLPSDFQKSELLRFRPSAIVLITANVSRVLGSSFLVVRRSCWSLICLLVKWCSESQVFHVIWSRDDCCSAAQSRMEFASLYISGLKSGGGLRSSHFVSSCVEVLASIEGRVSRLLIPAFHRGEFMSISRNVLRSGIRSRIGFDALPFDVV